MANESNEDFAQALQTEYEQDCGVTFGIIPLTALARLTRVDDGKETPIGREIAGQLRSALIEQKLIDASGCIQPEFDPRRPGFSLELPPGLTDLSSAVIDLLSSYRIERHIRRARDEVSNRLRKDVTLGPEFQALWERIKPKTTYRVEFETGKLIDRAVEAIKRMETIEKPSVVVRAGQLGVMKGGVDTRDISVAEEQLDYISKPVPDLLAYLQNETELTRSTLARILVGSGRLEEFFNNPQRFLDRVAGILKNELHQLLVDGIKYERVDVSDPDAEWEMILFKNEELINYLDAIQVNKSIYEYVVYDSDIEREFARRLDEREDIRFFVKLPGWFQIDTPVGKYNPDWAIVKQGEDKVYLVRETKATRDFLQLRTGESYKVRCGQRHFETLGMSFKVGQSADQV